MSPEHDVTPMASDHLPLRLARLFLIFPSQLAKNKKKHATPSWCPPEIWACYVGPSVTSETWERWAVGSFVYVRACVLLASKPKTPFFYIKKKLFNRQILSHWDRLPLELRQTIQWMADRQQAHDRLKRGWEKNTMSRLQRRLPILSSSTATKRRLRQVLQWFTPATLSTM